MSEYRLIDRIEIKDARQHLFCGWRSSAFVDVYASDVMHIEKDDFDKHRFTLSVEARVDYWCSLRDKEEAMKRAKEGMVRHLYAPLFGMTDRMRRAIYKGDEKTMLALCDEMEREMGWTP